jgi:hypothetical protein
VNFGKKYCYHGKLARYGVPRCQKICLFEKSVAGKVLSVRLLCRSEASLSSLSRQRPSTASMMKMSTALTWRANVAQSLRYLRCHTFYVLFILLFYDSSVIGYNEPYKPVCVCEFINERLIMHRVVSSTIDAIDMQIKYI